MAQTSVAASASAFAVPGRLPTAEFPASTWGDTFASFSLDAQVQERYNKEIEALKGEVRKMLIAEGDHATNEKRLILIDTLERLGVAYHFKQEIEDQLQHQISNFYSTNHDLFAVALWFRLLRQHHYHVSPSVFGKFKGKDGKFDEEMFSGDAEGLLSLYEAAHMRIHGEDILEEGLAFATHHLKLMAPTLECPLRDQVKRALELPLHRGFSRIEARHYISSYERDNACNEVLLKLTKLDFNYTHNLYKKELHDLYKWWDNFDLQSKLTYARVDKLPDVYFWSMAIHFEPEDSFLRLAIAKCILLTSILDDTYDNYATVEEAETFTEILQRWDINETDGLPDYMKGTYKFVLNTYEELLHEGFEQGRSFAAPYFREAIKELGRGYNQKLKWFVGVQRPTFQDYDSNIVITSTIYMLCTPAWFGMESTSDQVFTWLFNRPKFVVAAAKIGRYKNDLGSHERESREGQMLTAVTSYMKQHGITKQETLKRFAEIVEDAWKDLNAGWLSLPSFVPHDVADVVLNFARACEVVYMNSADGYTYPEKHMTPTIAALVVDPLII